MIMSHENNENNNVLNTNQFVKCKNSFNKAIFNSLIGWLGGWWCQLSEFFDEIFLIYLRHLTVCFK